MRKGYRTYLPEQELLLPPSLREWLPEQHLVYFVSDVVDQLDLSAMYLTLLRTRQHYQLQAAPVLSAKIQLEPLQEHICAK
jgi:hypothetical protein